MSMKSGSVVIVKRQTGTQIAWLVREYREGWLGYIFSLHGGTWTKTLRPIPEAEILGFASDAANASQRRVLSRLPIPPGLGVVVEDRR